jgi:hypothetical protein
MREICAFVALVGSVPQAACERDIRYGNLVDVICRRAECRLCNVKRTWLLNHEMSANDPKRTSWAAAAGRTFWACFLRRRSPSGELRD